MSSKIICPSCKVEITEEVPEGTGSVCKACGCRFVRLPEAKTELVQQADPGPIITKVMKCPHCEQYIILTIPVIIKTEIGDMTKKPAERCMTCKGKKWIHVPGPGDGEDVLCSECSGLGVIPVKKTIKK